jgi:hypothetical protein
MADPGTGWITAANLGLAAATLLAVLAVAGGIAHEFIWRRRRRKILTAGLDAEWRDLFHDSRGPGPGA